MTDSLTDTKQSAIVHRNSASKGQIKKLFSQMSNILTSFHSTCSNPKCQFELIPRDVLSVLFSFLPSTRDLGTLSCVCKRFNQHLREDKRPWVCLCLKWWTQNDFDMQISLEKEVVKECLELDCSKNWRWLGSCLAQEDAHNGPTWVHFYDDGEDEHLEFGERIRGELKGWGISLDLNEHIVILGIFNAGQLISGEKTHPGKYKYMGAFQDGAFHGFGKYQDIENGWFYEGNWKEDQKDGKGTMKWINGFKYEGEWKEDQPVDKEATSHPQIKECLERRICTSLVTQGSKSFGQFLVKHSRGYWCLQCALTCVSKETKLLGSKFYPGEECSCLGKDTCHARVANLS